MVHSFSIILGKAVRNIARLRGGSGSALPGLFIEKINPPFIGKTLSQLPKGIVLVSGTNGKTTTSKMVVELLEGQGLRVFTNRTGSNFTRGVAAALLSEISPRGKLDADIAVLELDEAHAIHFVRAIAPTYSLLLNVMRDQLDRFGEIDTTAKLLQTVADHTTKGLILNREDPLIRAIAANNSNKTIRFFGLHPELLSQFPTDANLHGDNSTESAPTTASVTLDRIDGSVATFSIAGDATKPIHLKLNGIYNLFNAAAALATVKLVMGGEFSQEKALTTLASITPAFGRGETIMLHGQPIELVLVKNPSGFRLGLSSFSPAGYATMVAINDNYADGRDMSWLWDVDFKSLQTEGVTHVGGMRAYDMTLRLQYDNVSVGTTNTALLPTLHNFIEAHPDTPKRIYCTYTAMLALRKELSRLTDVKEIDS